MSEFSLEPKNGDYASLVEKKGLYDKKMLEAQIRNAMLLQQQKSEPSLKKNAVIACN